MKSFTLISLPLVLPSIIHALGESRAIAHRLKPINWLTLLILGTRFKILTSHNWYNRIFTWIINIKALILWYAPNLNLIKSFHKSVWQSTLISKESLNILSFNPISKLKHQFHFSISTYPSWLLEGEGNHIKNYKPYLQKTVSEAHKILVYGFETLKTHSWIRG
jgi:hypothetical protein